MGLASGARNLSTISDNASEGHCKVGFLESFLLKGGCNLVEAEFMGR
jgi:hypothetical protein